jgi:hypothetical protein
MFRSTFLRSARGRRAQPDLLSVWSCRTSLVMGVDAVGGTVGATQGARATIVRRPLATHGVQMNHDTRSRQFIDWPTTVPESLMPNASDFVPPRVPRNWLLPVRPSPRLPGYTRPASSRNWSPVRGCSFPVCRAGRQQLHTPNNGAHSIIRQTITPRRRFPSGRCSARAGQLSSRSQLGLRNKLASRNDQSASADYSTGRVAGC